MKSGGLEAEEILGDAPTLYSGGGVEEERRPLKHCREFVYFFDPTSNNESNTITCTHNISVRYQTVLVDLHPVLFTTYTVTPS